MRRLIIIILAVCLFSAPAHAEIPKAYGDEEEIWSYLVELCPTEEISAGIVGYFFRESRLKADALVGWDIEDHCAEFISEIDSGLKDGSTREEFVRAVHHDHGGYGLGQWHSVSYLEAFYDYMSEHAESIADVKGQCEFTVLSIQENEELWEDLLNCKTAIQCGRRIGLRYDCTSVDGAEAIASFAQYYYERLRS